MTDDASTTNKNHIKTLIFKEMGDGNIETLAKVKLLVRPQLHWMWQMMWISISIVFDIYSATIKIMS